VVTDVAGRKRATERRVRAEVVDAACEDLAKEAFCSRWTLKILTIISGKKFFVALPLRGK